jgi:ribosome-associated translation inhibitor RaiA
VRLGVVKRFLKKFYAKARGLVPWKREQERVSVSGLVGEESVFKESLAAECEKALEKFQKRVPTVRAISVHVKSSGAGGGGGKKLFELKGTLHLDNGELFVGVTGRDLYEALTRMLYELGEEVKRAHSFRQEKRAPRDVSQKKKFWVFR